MRTLPLIAALLLAFGSASAADSGIFSNVAEGQALPSVLEGEPFRAQIRIANPYDRAMRIVSKDSTCVCNVLQEDDSFLIPGEETILHFETPTENKSGETNQRVWLFSSDPDFDPLEVRLSWMVRPLVAVDALPPNTRPTGRPEDKQWRDIYRLTAHERPDELHKLSENLIVSVPEDQIPEGGFAIEGIEYEGQIWRFVTKAIDERHWLVAARPADTAGTVGEGEFEETFTIRTNHPKKSAISIEIATAIDPDAGRPAANPFAAPPPGM
jgi:hypothetical protein